jgi:hypothetical protein
MGLSGPKSIGTGTTTSNAEIFDISGDGFGYRYNQNILILPQGYSGQTLNGSATITGETLSSVGISGGTYTWTAFNGDYVQISAFAEPEVTLTPTPTMTQTPTVTPTPTVTAEVTPTPTGTPAVTPTGTPSITPSVTATPAVTPTGTPAATSTPTPTPTPSPTIPVFSSNTDYNVCVTCGDNTFTVETEHPVWTNQYGQSVIQMNAVELGGRNGLNS